ncbi:MAG: hypothetical protein DWQ05_06795 [Calditrichaeota bacterium]|nr:MAG: hypothetical protein DWQ05_06795 [Calditrichota bacterium]
MWFVFLLNKTIATRHCFNKNNQLQTHNFIESVIDKRLAPIFSARAIKEKISLPVVNSPFQINPEFEN